MSPYLVCLFDVNIMCVIQTTLSFPLKQFERRESLNFEQSR